MELKKGKKKNPGKPDREESTHINESGEMLKNDKSHFPINWAGKYWKRGNLKRGITGRALNVPTGAIATRH